MKKSIEHVLYPDFLELTVVSLTHLVNVFVDWLYHQRLPDGPEEWRKAVGCPSHPIPDGFTPPVHDYGIILMIKMYVFA